MARSLQVVQQFPGTPELVFEACSDFHHAAERVSGIVRLDVLTDGPLGAGTRFRETRVVMGHEATEEMEITTFDPPHGYTIECTSHGAHFKSVFGFRANGGGTEVTLDFEATPQSIMARAMVPMMMGTVRKCVEQDLHDIRDWLGKDGVGTA